MKRTAIAVAWLIGAAIPLLISAVFVFGCCALPFHHVIHKAMPFCRVAIDMMRGEHASRGASAPATQKQKPATPSATELTRSFEFAIATGTKRTIVVADATAYRSFIALGALRCDRDVGLHLLIATLLI